MSAKDYSPVFSNGYKVEDRYLLILAKPNNRDYARLGLAISKKKVKLAVGRNRIKRIIRESFRHNHEVIKGLDIVVIAGRDIAQLTREQLRQNLDEKWQKLRNR